MSYQERIKINVSEHIEKKGKFNYLSWVYALDELQKQDEEATWEYREHIEYPDKSMMVMTTVTAFGKTLEMLLPVMDNRNQAIKNPDAFAINKAYMRCLAKNVAAHGIGLYIFAGEDIPDDTPPNPEKKGEKKKPTPEEVKREKQAAIYRALEANISAAYKIEDLNGMEDHKDLLSLPKPGQDKLLELITDKRAELANAVFHGDKDE